MKDAKLQSVNLAVCLKQFCIEETLLARIM